VFGPGLVSSLSCTGANVQELFQQVSAAGAVFGPGLAGGVGYTGALDQELFIRSVRQKRCLVRGWLAVSANGNS